MVGGIWLTAPINVASSVRNIEVMLKTITVIVVTVYGFSKILMMLTIRSLWLLWALCAVFNLWRALYYPHERVVSVSCS